ncbi:hypothetical protein DQ237_04310 [Blastococcus sp. TF02-8]|uniref:hypothetical protein n=1 Tax=Blastococcus sp. TF02-8 TaxID=2250574 RepID=UPI000DEACF31|nr:hypothetical protein [Blastococcus sp. TF02-8]RBY96850.1 hypothetical protein DQ237_04310 [Blastococcus sp. TF02-8]
MAVLAWIGVATASVSGAPEAQAAPTATVPIRDLTQLVVSVDQGGTVTFVNELQDKQLKVGGTLLPALVDVTVKTDVALTLPGQQQPKTLAPKEQFAQKFDASCVVGCWLTFTYRYESRAAITQPLIDATNKLLPPLPRPQPLVVNTLLPLPNLAGVNLPQLPPVQLPPLPQVQVPGGPGQTPVTPPIEQPNQDGPAQQGIDGSQYQYPLGGGGAANLAPATRSAIAAFDPSAFFVPATGGGARSATGGGSGGLAGSYDGASVPVFGQLAGLDGAALDAESAETVNASAEQPATLPAAALAAVVALAAVTAALVRTHQASRASR